MVCLNVGVGFRELEMWCFEVFGCGWVVTVVTPLQWRGQTGKNKCCAEG
jgi:hypothetical protein